MPMGSEEHDDGEMLAEREAEAEGPSPAEPAPPGLERCHRPIMRPWAPQRSATVWPGPCQRPGACYKLGPQRLVRGWARGPGRAGQGQ